MNPLAFSPRAPNADASGSEGQRMRITPLTFAF